MDKVTKVYSGLNQDYAPENQPEGTYRYALNAVTETRTGNLGGIANEESNLATALLPDDCTPIGKVYMTEGTTALFLVNTQTDHSHIGILTDQGKYEDIIKAKLGFSVNHQIDAVYRLRRGCGRTLYWTDGLNPPMSVNLDGLEDFQNERGNYVREKFLLQKSFSEFPNFSRIEIVGGGSLRAGSYNFSVQYLDQDLNPTEWVSVSDTIIIYHDKETEEFSTVRGSTNEISAYQEFGATNKAISLTLNNLDRDYPYYRIAIISSTTGTGDVSDTVFSQEISTTVPRYTYTGTSSGLIQGTVEEIQQFSNPIDTAEHISTIENRLILSNVKNRNINWCNLQKYASRIGSDLVLEEIVLNSTFDENNQKRGSLHQEKVGYLPGEIYAFSIVYVLEGGYTSPKYTIPGKQEGYDSRMSLNNKLENTLYNDQRSCQGELPYWGYDTQGKSLAGTQVRHHRFPLRSELGIPLYTKETNAKDLTINQLRISFTGSPPAEFLGTEVNYVATYTKGESTSTEQEEVLLEATGTLTIPADYGGDTRILSPVLAQSRETFELIKLEQVLEDNTRTPFTPMEASQLRDRLRSQVGDALYKSQIMGIQFRGIQRPPEGETGGHRVIGYYIVREPRTEQQKTILDTGVLTPLLQEERDKSGTFISHGHLLPNSDKLKLDVFALIHPEHKFNNREYTDTSEYLIEGYYDKVDSQLADRTVQDVQAGSSYDAENSKKREKDNDGIDLRVLTRDNQLVYSRALDTEVLNTNKTFYLNTLFSKGITDSQGESQEVYNLSSDNKIGIVTLNERRELESIRNRLPYVIMRRQLSDPYSDYETSAAYREHTNPQLFQDNVVSSISLFNGDSYISSMRYTSNLFYDIRMRSRRTKSGFLNFVVAYLSVIAGVTIAVASAGTAVAASAAVIGYGLSQLATGLKKGQLARVYRELYEQGLKDTVNDDDTQNTFGANPSDDEIQHFQDTLTELWFESSVNMNWRMGSTLGIPDFLDSPLGQAYREEELLDYAVNKVTSLDPSADGGKNYLGYTYPELYLINKDYTRRQREKPSFALGIEFDCCSECREEFPHRITWTQVSFAEELTDNFRTFLPNNYTDIPGETGSITNTFTIQNNFYIQTKDALWHIPQNIQERVTGDIVSFIGTGEFFGIPPRKILDDATGNSGGCQHKWSVTKTPYGVIYVSEAQGAVYQFDGNKLTPLNYKGLYSWFRNNIPLRKDATYKALSGLDYPYSDNPSSKIGTGFITTYDARYERILLTKKDFVYKQELRQDFTGGLICASHGEVKLFKDYRKTISEYESQGWKYLGVNEDTCELEFQRPTEEELAVEVTSKISNSTDIHVFFDTSGSFGTRTGRCLQSIDSAIDSWIADFTRRTPDWRGQLYKYQDTSERWLRYAQTIAETTYNGQGLEEKEILVISFCNEASPIYHGNGFTGPTTQAPTSAFIGDYLEFTNKVHPLYKSFIGIHYPIVFGQGSGSCNAGTKGNLPHSREFLKHSIAALYGTSLDGKQLSQVLPERNPGFSEQEWFDLLTALGAFNPYPSEGLLQYGWSGKWNRSASADGTVITDEQFNRDIEELLSATITVEEQFVSVPVLELAQVPGDYYYDVELNNSWTLSYSFKTQSWVSWHSYLPSFYVNTTAHFYSWLPGKEHLYQHHRDNYYQTYYDTKYPHQIEYVSVSTPLQNRTWDHIKLLASASRYQEETNSRKELDEVIYNGVVLYNSNQCSGLLELKVKDDDAFNYMLNQVRDNDPDSIIISRDEKEWTFNNLRDLRENYSVPIFSESLQDRQENYYVDKVLNEQSINYNKDWEQLGSFRDKYLCVRLIFDNFDDIRIVLNYSVENEQPSVR